MNKKGFIATSLIYSFFLIFITLFLTIIADYLQDKVLLNTIERGIKNDINNSLGIQDFQIGDKLYFINSVSLNGVSISNDSLCNITNIYYKKSDEPNDILELDCNGTIRELNITSSRLTRKSSNDGFIDIEGVSS